MTGIPYWCRIGALLALASTMIIRDRRRGSTERQWEYGCLFVGGMVGALYGAANDAITVRISPEYFAIGKGLESGPSLVGRAIRLGAEAGFSAAAVAAAIWLFVIRHTKAPTRCRLVVRTAWIPLVVAVVLSVAAPAVFGHFDPLRFAQRLNALVPPCRFSAFLMVWWTHIGAYSGLCLGLIVAMLISRRREDRWQNYGVHDGCTRSAQ